MMNAIGLPKNNINTVMDCISSVTFCILVNGKMTDEFSPKRRVRLGNLLFSFLFFISAEGMCALLDDVVNRKAIQGLKIANNTSSITHFCFADDSILFFCVKETDCKKMAHILKTYEEASSQLINMEKLGL